MGTDESSSGRAAGVGKKAVNLGEGGINEAQPGRILQPSRRQPVQRHAHCQWPSPAARHQAVVFGQRDDAPGSWAQEVDDYGKLAATTAAAMKWLTRRLNWWRQLASRHADLRRLGSDRPRPQTRWTISRPTSTISAPSQGAAAADTYFPQEPVPLGTYLAKPILMDDFIRSVVATCDYVRAKKRAKKHMYLAFDEWNTWNPRAGDLQGVNDNPWQVAPPLFEAPYTHQDALVVGLMLITLLRHADRVKIACMAQLVNTIAPIRTVAGGGAVRETIFYPLLHTSRLGRGTVLDLQVRSPHYENDEFDTVPMLDAVATLNEAREEVTIFAVNRSQDGPLPLEGDLRGVAGYGVVEHLVMEHADPRREHGGAA